MMSEIDMFPEPTLSLTSFFLSLPGEPSSCSSQYAQPYCLHKNTLKHKVSEHPLPSLSARSSCISEPISSGQPVPRAVNAHPNLHLFEKRSPVRRMTFLCSDTTLRSWNIFPQRGYCSIWKVPIVMGLCVGSVGTSLLNPGPPGSLNGKHDAIGQWVVFSAVFRRAEREKKPRLIHFGTLLWLQCTGITIHQAWKCFIDRLRSA